MLAIALVLGFHDPGEGAPEWFAAAASFGWAGVDLFFVLSGFLIGRQLLAPVTLGERPRLGAFCLRRLLRVLPAYWVVLAVYALVPGARWLAGVTYCVYLSHKLVIHAVHGVLAEHGMGAYHPVTLLVSAACVLAVAAVLHLGVERPFLRLRERWGRPPVRQALATSALSPSPGPGPHNPRRRSSLRRPLPNGEPPFSPHRGLVLLYVAPPQHEGALSWPDPACSHCSTTSPPSSTTCR